MLADVGYTALRAWCLDHVGRSRVRLVCSDFCLLRSEKVGKSSVSTGPERCWASWVSETAFSCATYFGHIHPCPVSTPGSPFHAYLFIVA